MVATPRPSSPMAQRVRAVELDLGGGVRAVAELVLQALEAQRVDAAVGQEARHQEAGEPARRLRQHQERVRHRRRHEPLVAGDDVFAARSRRRRTGSAVVVAARTSVPPCFSVMPMPSVTARLASRRAQSSGRSCRAGCAAPTRRRLSGSLQQHRHGGVGHGDGAAVPRLHLRRHVEGAGARARARPAAAPRPPCRGAPTPSCAALRRSSCASARDRRGGR